jgi:hypothetical protein
MDGFGAHYYASGYFAANKTEKYRECEDIPVSKMPLKLPNMPFDSSQSF